MLSFKALKFPQTFSLSYKLAHDVKTILEETTKCLQIMNKFEKQTFFKHKLFIPVAIIFNSRVVRIVYSIKVIEFERFIRKDS